MKITPAWHSEMIIFSLLHYVLEKLLHFALKILLHFASMLLHFVLVLYFALVLHFAVILISFCISITICGDYYIFWLNILRWFLFHFALVLQFVVIITFSGLTACAVQLLRHDAYCPISGEIRPVHSQSNLRILL